MSHRNFPMEVFVNCLSLLNSYLKIVNLEQVKILNPAYHGKWHLENLLETSGLDRAPKNNCTQIESFEFSVAGRILPRHIFNRPLSDRTTFKDQGACFNKKYRIL
eukprot:GHVP01010914.1.p1 GENE.GHVP01010914.1~~GHVP01010914.1.p1  ORF type:complete len:105 (+),score=8.13 GHVP01010914.1:23-337(+)